MLNCLIIFVMENQVGTGISGDQFDEFEEVQLKCSHYIILLATNSDEINQTILPLVKSLSGENFDL